MVEVEADLGEGGDPRWRYGSGLVIGDRTVLTAAHVVLDATVLTIRGPDKRSWSAAVDHAWIGDPDRFDLALLEVCDLPDALPPLPVVVVDRDVTSGEHVEAWSVGFPLFQEIERDDAGRSVRETAEVRGSIPPLTGLVARQLSLKVTEKPYDLPPQETTLGESQWSGMSGAAVLVGDALVGVVSEHARRRGPSDITVTPLDVLSDPDRRPANAAEWWARLGVSDSSRLPRMPPRRSAEETAVRRVVGIRPVGSLELWQDRDALCEELTALLRKRQRIISVVGRRGVGKSAVVTRVCADFEQPQAADTAGIDGIVYLSTRTGAGEMTLSHIFHQVVALLPEKEQIRLSNRWASAGEAALDDLLDSLRARRIVVVLDNLDDLQHPDTGEFRRPDVRDFLVAVSRVPRPPQVMTTSQQRLVLPPDVWPCVAERELHDGLEPEFGAALLRQLDADGSAGLRQQDDASLRALSDRVGGVPRGLQLLVGYGRDHRLFGGRRLLDSTSAPEVVLKQLVSTAYDRLVGAARDVMEVIAVARVPLPPEAFIALCEDQPADQVENALDDLIKRFALILGTDGLVRLHPLDTDQVYSKLERDRQVELHLRMARWYAGRRTDPLAWRGLTDADPLKHEYRHRWWAGHHAEALDVLAGVGEFLGRHGDSPVLRSAVAAADEAGLEGSPSKEVCLGYAEFFSGSLVAAVYCFRRASRLAGGVPDWDLWTGIALRKSGRGLEAARVLSRVASDEHNPRAVRIEAAFELGLSWCYARCLDDAATAISQLEELIEPGDPALPRAYVANVSAVLHLIAGRLPESVSAAEEGVAAYHDSPRSDVVEYMRNTRALALLLMGRDKDASADLSAAATSAAALGQDWLEGIVRTNLAWASLHLGAWDAAAAAARQAASRLTSSSAIDAAAPLALLEALEASADQEIDELLRRAAERTRANPDFHQPAPSAIAALVSALTNR